MVHNAETKLKVFIIDDSAPVRERLVRMLNDIRGVQVVGQAADAPQTLTTILEAKPDVVILDIRLPGGNGITVLRRLQKEQPAPKVIMLTNYTFEQYRRTSLAAGASYFFDKSVEFDKVREALEQLRVGLTSGAPGPITGEAAPG